TLFSALNPPAIVTTQGMVEDWTIENRAREVHVFHIHQLHFVLLARDGVTLPPPSQRFIDTAVLPFWNGTGAYPSITARMDFRAATTVGDFVFHCHILEHMDHGMMASIRVLPAPSSGVGAPAPSMGTPSASATPSTTPTPTATAVSPTAA